MKKANKFPVQQSKKSFKRTILEHIVEIQTQITSIKRNMRKDIIEEVKKEIGDKISMIDATYRQAIVIQNIWFDKGLITREEINDKYEEIKKKKAEKKNG